MKFMEKLLAMVKENFRRDGSLMPVAFVMVRRNPKTGVKFAAPVSITIPAHFQNDEDKERFASIIRQIVQDGDAESVIIVSEHWYADPKIAMRWRETHGSLEGAPGVREVIGVTEERRGAITSWSSEITRTERGASLGPWKKNVSTRKSVEGRFVGFLDPEA